MYVRVKTFLTVSVLLCSVLSGRSQANDSDVDWYESFFKQWDTKSAENLLEQSMERLAATREENDAAAEAQALKAIGLIQLTRYNEYDKAMDYFIKALVIEDSLGLKSKQIFTYLAISQVFEEVDNYPRSEEFLENALNLSKKNGNKVVLVLILNHLGKVNAALGRIEKAFENFENVLEYKDEIKQPQAEAEALYNIGHLYTQQKRYQEALSSHKKALVIWRSIGDKKAESISLNDIGELYHRMKNNERALANHVAALEIQKRLDDKKGIAVSCNNIGALYFGQQDLEHAVAYLKMALSAGQESQASDQIIRSYEYLTDCYNQLGDYKQALYYSGQIVPFYDFIQNAKNDQQLLEAQNRYTLNKKESEIDRLESDRKKREIEIEDQKKFRNVLYLIIALTFIIVVLILYLYRQKQRSNKILLETNEKINHQNLELHDLNATKDKFFSIISHDLKGPLNSLTSFSNLLINHIDGLSKEEIQMLAKDLDKSVKNLFALLENLLEWSRSQTGNIDFKPEVFDVTALLENNKELLLVQAQSKQIGLDNLAIAMPLQVKADKNSVSTVIRNLMSNAIKFTPEGGTVVINARQISDAVEVSIKDTGVGMSAEIMSKLFRIDTKHSTKGTANEKGTGLGLILCKDFIEKNGGKIWVVSEVGKGSTFYFTLPTF